MSVKTLTAKIILCAFFCLFGFLGNWFRLELFFNVYFLSGSVFVILAILMLGGLYGTIAGIVAGISMYLIWNHPWAAFILTGEAAFVTLLYSRRQTHPVFCDILYWVFIGVPVGYFVYRHVMNMQVQYALVTILGRAVNGVFNALVASLVYMISRFMKKTGPARITYSELLFITMASLVLLPSIILFITGMRAYQDGKTHTLESRVFYVSRTAQRVLGDWIREHQGNIGILSTLVGDPDASTFQRMQRYVEITRAASPAFKRMGVVDKDSLTVAYSPLTEDGRSTLGINLSDRPHVPVLQREQSPLVTDVMMARVGNPVPIVLFLTPIIVSGTYKGFCTATVETSHISGILSHMTENGLDITVVDGTGQVIASTIPELHIMDPFPRSYPRWGAAPGSKPLTWRPDGDPDARSARQWENAFLFAVVSLANASRWEVIVEASCLTLARTISDYTIFRLALLSILILGTVTLSHLLSNGFISTVVKLQVLTRSLLQRLDDATTIMWPSSRIRELADLSTNFRDMASSLLYDITERKRTVAALRESEERYRMLFEDARDGIALADMETGILVDCNQALCRLVERTRKEVIGRPQSILHPTVNLLDGESPSFREHRTDPAGTALEESLISKSGKTIFVEIRGSRIYIKGRDYLMGVFRDTTERNHAEAALRRSEANYRRLFENIREMVTVYEVRRDEGGRIVERRLREGNPAFLRTAGVSSIDEIRGKTSDQVLGKTWSDSHLSAVQEAMDSNSVRTQEVYHPESERHYLTNIVPLDADSYLGTGWDITELRETKSALGESRLKFETALASMVDAVFISDRQGRFIDFNDAFARFHRFRNKDECLRTLAEYPAILDVFLADGQPAPLDMWAVPRALRGETATNAEYALRRKDTGESWEGSYSFSPIMDKNGEIIGSVVVARDITEHKKADRALRDSLEEKVALLKEVHHRVKNNLQIVASLLGLQASRSNNRNAVGILHDTRNRVKSMALLHETLYRSGNLASINFTTYLKDLCGRLLLSFGPVASRVRLEYQVADIRIPLEHAVPCGLIVSELVSNSLKYGFPGHHTGRIFITLEAVGCCALALGVSDEGVGLPPGFDPAGTGTLGLELVSRLADQLGGHFEVLATQGPGAAFRVSFPAPKDSPREGES